MKRHWHKEAKAFKKMIIEEYELTPDELHILDGACEQLSQYWKASELLDKEGLTFATDSGNIRQHPAAGLVKTSWAGFLAGCRLLQIGAPADAKNRVGRPSGGN